LVALSIFHLVTEDLDFAENHRTQVVLTVVAVTSLLVYLWRLLASTFQKK